MNFQNWLEARVRAVNESYEELGIGLVPVPCPEHEILDLVRTVRERFDVQLADEYVTLLRLSNGTSGHCRVFPGSRHRRLDRATSTYVEVDDDILSKNVRFQELGSNSNYFSYGYHDLGWLVYNKPLGNYWIRKGAEDHECLGGAEEMMQYALA